MKDRVAIVTGAGSGIGAAVARLFLRSGAKLIINDVDRSSLKQFRQSQKSADAEIEIVSGDASTSAVAKRMAEAAIRRFGRLDILVNNAGIAGSSVGDGPVTSSDPAAWEKVLRINLGSVYMCSRYAIPAMIQSGGGSIVNVSSVLALTGSADFFKSHAYAASKGAILSLTRAMAAHYADQHIRVNAVCPGLVETAMVERAKKRDDLLAYVASKQRLKAGLGSAESVADAIAFLASDEARFVTGVFLPVDGGWLSGY